VNTPTFSNVDVVAKNAVWVMLGKLKGALNSVPFTESARRPELDREHLDRAFNNSEAK
jgi:hypothetical protein